ncbi:hypothetical protein B0H21DRAFT_692131 [Amylocystis lapponica]|nr:hypothetical protein B0H21DRAFT_692131 [Amylocystis lapponica]
MAISRQMASLLGFVCEAILFGAYCILFSISLIVLVQRRSTREVKSPLLFAHILLFLCCAGHFCVEFDYFYNLFQYQCLPDFIETKTRYSGAILISVIDFLSDGILIFRCWLVWNKSHWIVILPSLTALSGFACIIAVAHLSLAVGLQATPPTIIIPLGTAGYALFLATNIIVTTLIVGRIWYLSFHKFRAGGSLSRSTTNIIWKGMGIVVESGAMYLVTQLVFVVLYAINNGAYRLMAVIVVQICGIAPTLIVIRVGLGIASDSHGPTSGTAASIIFNHHPTTHRESMTAGDPNTSTTAAKPRRLSSEAEDEMVALRMQELAA